jgi:hypothetical protein
MTHNMNSQEAFFFMLKAATVYYKVSADFERDADGFKPTKEEVRLATIYQNYIDEMVAIGGDLDL